jgi:hypothetical protein
MGGYCRKKNGAALTELAFLSTRASLLGKATPWLWSGLP